jgi:HSP20 family protein
MNITLNKRGSILDELETLQRQVTDRAYQIFNQRGAAAGRALEDWLTAERETVWKPAVEVVEKDDEFLVEAALAGVDAKQLNIEVTPEELLIRADITHQHRPGERIHTCEFRPGKLFRTIRFPRRIDPDHVRSDYRDGLLRVWVPAAKEAEAKRIEIQTN